ncbi:MAG TPA: hypothetical protein VGI45_01365 [Terracidiphilus sp.]|jgi:hypothetical protein
MSQQPVIPAAEIFYRPRLDSLVPTQKINIKRRDGTVPVNNLRYFCGRPSATTAVRRIQIPASIPCRLATLSFASPPARAASRRPWISICTAHSARVFLSATRTRYDACCQSGAMPAQLRDVDSCVQSHSQGNVRITLQPAAKTCWACVNDRPPGLSRVSGVTPYRDTCVYRSSVTIFISPVWNVEQSELMRSSVD